MPYNSSDEFDIINLVEFNTYQTPQPQNKTQNHLHGGHLVPPDPWDKFESQRGPSGAGRTPGSADPTWQGKPFKLCIWIPSNGHFSFPYVPGYRKEVFSRF